MQTREISLSKVVLLFDCAFGVTESENRGNKGQSVAHMRDPSCSETLPKCFLHIYVTEY